jgi:hypothetical protein
MSNGPRDISGCQMLKLRLLIDWIVARENDMYEHVVWRRQMGMIRSGALNGFLRCMILHITLFTVSK